MRASVLERPGFDLGEKLRLFSLGTPEDGVDERAFVRTREGDGFMDGRVFGNAASEELVESEAEQVLRLRFDRSASEPLDQFIEQVEIPDHSEEEVLGEAAVGWGQAQMASGIFEQIGGVARRVLPGGEGFEGTAAGGRKGIAGHRFLKKFAAEVPGE